MTGVVLCGGQSSRMGTDKGMLLHKSVTWAQHAINKLQALELPVLLSVNEQQYGHYSKLFQNPMLIKDDGTLTVGGPLKGILSVHLQQPGEDLLVLACDMRNMKTEVLAHLITAHLNHNAEAVVFRSADTIEPLCGIYTAKGLHKLSQQYKHGHLKKFSMHHLLQLLTALYVPTPEAWQHCFRNFNSAEDLRAL